MNDRHTAWATLIAMSLSSAAIGDDIQLRDGLYEVQFRLELPHLETHAVDRIATICIDQVKPTHHRPPFPLLSQNDIFADCQIENVERKHAGFSYDITCTGRGAAKATATYITTPNNFKSRIAITQGAKNMTMTEVQNAHRLGPC